MKSKVKIFVFFEIIAVFFEDISQITRQESLVAIEEKEKGKKEKGKKEKRKGKGKLGINKKHPWPNPS